MATINIFHEGVLTPRKSSLAQPSLRSHLRAAWMVARIDWKHFWRYPLNAISSVLQPLIWLTPVYFMGRAFSVGGEAHGFAAYSGTTDYMSFILIGNALSQFISAVFWGMGFSLKNDMDTGVLESNWLAPVPRTLLLVGKTLNSLFVTAFTSLIILLFAGPLFGFRISGSVLTAFLAILPMLLGLYGFGFAFAALVLVVREANTMVDISNFLVSLLSGADFPIQSLPRWLLPVSLAIPLSYGFDAVRGILLGTKTVLPLRWELAILAGFMLIMIVTGLIAFRALERYVRQRGTLGQH